MKRMSTAACALAAASALVVGASSLASAAPPRTSYDDGAFVRLLGNPADGTAKFQVGWADDTVASDAAGYWVGLYDVTNSHYEWSYDTGPIELGDSMALNARPTPDLADGDYKVVFFVRGSYSPVSNLAEIELPFTVDASMD